MTSLIYSNKQFNQQGHAYPREACLVKCRQATQSNVRVVDWAARTDELLSIFNDDSMPSASGKFGTFLY